MTTAEPQHARRGRFREAWHRFRRWRRARPFWGGLLTVLAGLEIFGTTQMSLGGLSFQMGPTGFLSWLIPTILVACGLLIWFSPQQRIFYAVVASVTALFSLIGVNLGGFFVGLLLGMVGSALGFAWAPVGRPAAAPATGPVGQPVSPAVGPVGQPVSPAAGPVGPEVGDHERPALVEYLSGGDGSGGGAAEPAPYDPMGRTGPDAAPPLPGQRDPRLYAVLLVLLGLAAAVALAVPGPTPVRAAAPGQPGPACPTRPGPSGTPTAPPSATPTSASPSPSPSSGADGDRDSDGNIITDILDGIGDLLGGGRDDEEKATTPTPSGTPSAGPTAPAPPSRQPPAAGTTCATPGPTPSRTGAVEEGRPLPRIAAEPGQPVVGATPSKLTGSKVTMTGLRFEGIVDLPTADGTLKALKFSMDRAVTDDFLLRVVGPAGRTMRFATDRLTVQGDVAFYATRFVGRLLGIKITLTPDLPFPDDLPITSPIPITFTEPAIDLAFVNSDVLTARPKLRLTLD